MRAGVWSAIVSALLLLGPPVFAEGPAAACTASCERHVPGKAARARICGRCVVSGGEPSAWISAVEKLPDAEPILKSALQDPDWRVGRAAASALAAVHGIALERELAWMLLEATPDQRGRACLTIVRVGAAESSSFSRWRRRLYERGGPPGRKAFSVLARCEREVRNQLELELYAVDPREQLEALRHLGTLTGRGAVGAVLEAMRSRPAESDPIAAKALHLEAEAGGPPLGLLLLRAATERNQPLINRLVSVYAKQVAALVAEPPSSDPVARRALVRELAVYGPLAARELEQFVLDEQDEVAVAAARALASGADRTLEEEVRRRARGGEPVGVRARWVMLLGRAGREVCGGGALRELAADHALSPTVRAAALAALGDCGHASSLATILTALTEPSVEIRAGAVRGLHGMPLRPEVKKAAADALDDASPEIIAAALPVVAGQRQKSLQPRIVELLGHDQSAVRVEAAKALGAIGANDQVSRLADALRQDADPTVRVACAEALGRLGGPRAAAALADAAKGDTHSRVRHVASRQLRELGFTRSE